MSTGFLATLLSRLTFARATLLDNLDAAISTRASGDYYTTTRAALLDNLDAAITSRASATDYTSTRAAFIDNLDATITSRAAVSDIKNVQQQEFLASGVWSRPTGVTWVEVVLVGGGGSGGNYSNGRGAGGGGGEVVVGRRFWVGSDLTVTIGAGGKGSYIEDGGASLITGAGINIQANGGRGGSSGEYSLDEGLGGGSNSCYSARGGNGGGTVEGVYPTGCPGFAPAGSSSFANEYPAGGGSYGVGGNGDQSSPTGGVHGGGGGCGGGGVDGGDGGDGYCLIIWEE